MTTMHSTQNRITTVAALSCLIVALQQTLIVPATARLTGILDTTPDMVSWMVTATLLTGAIATPIFGRLADLVGKRRMLLVSMAFVFVGSLIAPLGSVGAIIAGRALQGIGTALVPVAMAQVRESLPGHKIGSAMAIISAMLGVGGSIGIPLGGVILDALGWQSIFWISAALSLVSLVMIRLVMPDNTGHHGDFDYAGALLLAAGLVGLLVAISQGSAWGWLAPATLGSAAIGVAAFAAWAWWELRATHPLVNLSTMAIPSLAWTNIASLILGIMMFTNLLLTTRRLQNPVEHGGFGWSASAAGLAMIPTAIIMFAVAAISARLAKAYGAKAVMAIGAGVSVAAYAATTLAPASAWLVITWTTVISAGVGLGYAALPMLVTAHCPAHENGAAQGVNALLRAVGTAVSSAFVGSVLAALRVMVGEASVPAAQALTWVGIAGIVFSALVLIISVMPWKGHAAR